MDNLKPYAKSERKLELFTQAIWAFSDDVSTVLGLEKCVVLVVKKGKIVRGIQLPDEMHMGEVNFEKYKYLEVLQLELIMNREKMKSKYT